MHSDLGRAAPLRPPAFPAGTAIAALLILAGTLRAQDPQEPPQEPQEKDLDIEELMNVQVTSPSKKEQALMDVAAAIYVIRGDDIKRRGVTSLPEALRSVPGMQVARSRSSSWAVSARGFSDSSSNKLLVLIDGRSVYSPLHSGVFWDVQDTFLEDVDRIEVIRGPGGSLWGSNAINGVVNVITKSAEETQGVVVQAGGGTEERAFGAVRYGFKAGEDHYVRVYAKYFGRDDTVEGVDNDEDVHDGWFMGRAGFRSDWKTGPGDRMTLMGDGYDGQIKEFGNNPSLTSPTGMEPFRDRIELRGGHLLFRWEHEIDPTSGWTLQVYYDRNQRDASLFKDGLHTGDLDFQHRFRWAAIHDVNWGLGYRIFRSDFGGDFAIQVDPEGRTDDLVSAFVQDEIALVEDRLRLTVGSKFEHNDYSGFEYQPSVRMAWKMDDSDTVWVAASRAVRTPSIIDADLRINAFVQPGPTPVVSAFLGNSDFKSEELVAYEAGYRTRPVDFITADLAVFYNIYDRLRSIEGPGASFLEADPPPQHLVFPLVLANGLDGHTWGAEAAFNAQAAQGVLIQANYAYLRMHLSDDATEGRDPQHTAWMRARIDLGPGWNLDAVARYVSRLKAFDIDRYIEGDVRLAWKVPDRNLEVALVGQNLVHESHPEFGAEATRSEIERGVYLSVMWGF